MLVSEQTSASQTAGQDQPRHACIVHHWPCLPAYLLVQSAALSCAVCIRRYKGQSRCREIPDRGESSEEGSTQATFERCKWSVGAKATAMIFVNASTLDTLYRGKLHTQIGGCLAMQTIADMNLMYHMITKFQLCWSALARRGICQIHTSREVESGWQI